MILRGNAWLSRWTPPWVEKTRTNESWIRWSGNGEGRKASWWTMAPSFAGGRCSEQKSLEDRKQALIANLLKQKETAIREFDDKLATLGYEANSSGKSRRSHHRKQATPPRT